MATQEILDGKYTGSRAERSNKQAEELADREYKYGWSTDIESETFPPGLDENVVRMISAKKEEPEWLLEWRLKAFRHWLTMEEPHWLNGEYSPIDYQAASYYSAPKKAPTRESLDSVADKIRPAL